tara:strand:+ start:244 stop:636 length:393 start_codon:yes stop_codon:yes gene_type:complete
MGNITETSVFENMNQFDTSFNETIYNSSYMIGVSEVGPNVREISLLALLDEGGALTNNDGTRIPQKEINEIQDIAVVWNYDDGGDTNIHQIYNHDTGEIYWEDHDENWSDGDELILSSLLMYADLESTII